MPLLDHFHPPLAPSRKWESFHAFWSTAIAERLNGRLPERYFAEAQIHIGTQVEVDIATLESTELIASEPPNGVASAVAVESYAPPMATGAFSAVFPDDIEVRVFHESGGVTLVAAVELVSPANKDRPETRRAFAAKCAAYLQRGVGLAVVDIVTERRANLHDELMELMRLPDRFANAATLYAVAYRPVHRESTGNQTEFWARVLMLGQPLPTLPLWLRGGPVMPVELEEAYQEAKKRGRL
jgi:hypothetical protein